PGRALVRRTVVPWPLAAAGRRSGAVGFLPGRGRGDGRAGQGGMNASGRPSMGWSRRIVPTIPILLAFAALSALPAAHRMARLYQHLRPELDELLPPDALAGRGARTRRARAAGSQYLGVVIRGANAGPAAAFAAELGARVSAFAATRPDLISAVKTDLAAERAFFAKRGALYLPLE